MKKFEHVGFIMLLQYQALKGNVPKTRWCHKTFIALYIHIISINLFAQKRETRKCTRYSYVILFNTWHNWGYICIKDLTSLFASSKSLLGESNHVNIYIYIYIRNLSFLCYQYFCYMLWNTSCASAANIRYLYLRTFSMY